GPSNQTIPSASALLVSQGFVLDGGLLYGSGHRIEIPRGRRLIDGPSEAVPTPDRSQLLGVVPGFGSNDTLVSWRLPLSSEPRPTAATLFSLPSIGGGPYPAPDSQSSLIQGASSRVYPYYSELWKVPLHGAAPSLLVSNCTGNVRFS